MTHISVGPSLSSHINTPASYLNEVGSTGKPGVTVGPRKGKKDAQSCLEMSLGTYGPLLSDSSCKETSNCQLLSGLLAHDGPYLKM